MRLSILCMVIACCYAKSIERVSAPSLREFMENYAMRSTPVIITNYSNRFEKITAQHILDKCGHIRMRVSRRNKTSNAWANLQEARIETLSYFVHEGDKTDIVGIFDSPIAKTCPEVFDGYLTVPKYIAQDFFQRVPKSTPFTFRDGWPSLFWGMNGSFGGLHRDAGGTAFWQYVIEGKKEWRVLSPNFLGLSRFRDIDFFSEPAFHVWEATLEPGEMIYIPGNCPHQVKNIGTTIALAGNLISKDSMETMKKIVPYSKSSRNIELQNTLMRRDFDTSFSYEVQDMSWREYKSPYKRQRAENSLFDWVRGHGGYVHKCLEYRTNGMFASCNIPPNETLTKIPSSLIMTIENHSKSGVLSMVRKLDRTNTPYTAMLPTTCQAAYCRPINISEVTVLGANDMRSRNVYVWAQTLTQYEQNRVSMIGSRRWFEGLVPVNDLFNHGERKCIRQQPLKGNNAAMMVSHVDGYTPGEEIFNNYGFKSHFQAYFDYGFIPRSKPSCHDALRLRINTHREFRIECIANSISTMEHMMAELVQAQKVGDTAMIHGAVRWMEKNKPEL